jgi:hypothetical protein
MLTKPESKGYGILKRNDKEDRDKFINELNIPENILDWLWSSIPDQKVARYLRGHTDARMRAPIEGIPDMTNEFNEWVEELILHRPTIWPYGPK